MNESKTKTNGQPHVHIPDDLRPKLPPGLAPDDLKAAAGYDLDEHGRYAEGWLLLTDDQLGHFLRRNGSWEGSWEAISKFKKAVMVEGLGMGLLRLTADDTVVAEYRYTLRHAREVARLHRRLEKHMEGKADVESPGEE